MLKSVDFQVLRDMPTRAHYRRGWVPSPGMGLSGIWFGAVVADASGQNYWGVRGCDDFLTGMTHVVSPVCGFRSLPKDLGADAPHLYLEYSTIDWFEPLQYVDDGDTVQLSFPSGRIERDANGFHWYDASNRWEIHGRTVSDIVLTHVPAQDGIDDDVYYRHELMYATGRVDGIEVSGYAHQDFAYGPPTKVYTELPIARHLQGMWVSWLHEFDDGQLGGGSFWQGREGVDFGPGYQLKDGVTTVHDDVTAEPTFNKAGRMTALDATIGTDSYSFAFESSGSPLHVFGSVTSTSSGVRPARSWCWVEYTGNMLTPELLDAATAVFALARGLDR
ncbi:hypothetical protein [Mycobacterium sp. 852002-10029_SCH5224772]|uniref:hypothetical protein n=1 Tax=Mycobacterium sp. 852002-10029_SCH5224772 TaxID=1834083 RepID=UPI0007FE1F9A|nr:hypothetical protein [Mycobacterium sp. 852002-10029_SCH5224772]OBF11109.1 hypothetical protein A5775_15850 [Mycobacterium sp. 852002-10029_SCH5224772]